MSLPTPRRRCPTACGSPRVDAAVGRRFGEEHQRRLAATVSRGHATGASPARRCTRAARTCGSTISPAALACGLPTPARPCCRCGLRTVIGGPCGRSIQNGVLTISAADGTGAMSTVACPERRCDPTDWSPDGRGSWQPSMARAARMSGCCLRTLADRTPAARAAFPDATPGFRRTDASWRTCRRRPGALSVGPAIDTATTPRGALGCRRRSTRLATRRPRVVLRRSTGPAAPDRHLDGLPTTG